MFCPYHSNLEWRRLKDEEPEAFAEAVAFERAYQAAKIQTVSEKGFVPFVHAARVPLDKVDLSTDLERGQPDLFINECEGMCGI